MHRTCGALRHLTTYTRAMTIERKMIYEGRVIKVSVDTVELPNGRRVPLEIVRHPGGAAAVAIDADHRVCLRRQYRHAAGGSSTSCPPASSSPANHRRSPRAASSPRKVRS